MLRLFLTSLFLLFYTFSLTQNIDLCNPLLTLKADGRNYNYLEWYVDETFYGNDESITISLSDTGIISVTLFAYNDLCETKFTKSFKISPCNECMIYIPDAVTPNFDNINDVWEPVTECEYKFEIYNRWGSLIYMGPPAWNADVQNDVYVYRVTSKTKIYIGRVTVVR